jgi:hypothetical protein
VGDLLARAQAEIVASVAAGERAQRVSQALATGRRLAAAGTSGRLSRLELVPALAGH